MRQHELDSHSHRPGRVSEGEDSEEGAEKLLEEIKAKNLPNLGKRTDV